MRLSFELPAFEFQGDEDRRCQDDYGCTDQDPGFGTEFGKGFG